MYLVVSEDNKIVNTELMTIGEARDYVKEHGGVIYKALEHKTEVNPVEVGL